MIRILLACLALLAALPASAACVWSSAGAYEAKAVCADGDEIAPTLITEGLGLISSPYKPASGFSVTAEADASQTITSGTLKAYIWDPWVAAWARAPDLDLTASISGERRLTWPGFTVTAGVGRVAYAPSVVTLSSGGITIYITGAPGY